MDKIQMLKLLEGIKLGGLRYAPAEITEANAMVYLRGLQGFSALQIKEACMYAMTNETEFPPVARLREICSGQTKSIKEVGQDVASLIEKNISTWGSWHPKQAEQAMGELAWEVVTRLGGWTNVCDVTNDQIPSCKKQWRELAESLSKGYLSNGHNEPPRIPGKTAVPSFLLD